VTIGDSLTQGFQSGAIFNTDLSFPAIIAYEMGCYEQFRKPTYLGFGGSPINLEFLIRELEKEFGDHLDRWSFHVPYSVDRPDLGWHHGSHTALAGWRGRCEPMEE
jgi:hypothetical protein